MSPEISVVMAVYNGEAFLDAAIESIVRQTRADFEFLIVDDGSTDQTPALLARWAERDGRIRVLRQRRAGLTRCLNRGLALAQGEFVARMDADDVAFPARFERQVEFLRQRPDHVAVGSAVLWIDPEGEVLHEAVWPETSDVIERLLLQGKGGLPHPTMMARRAALEQIGGYREEFWVAQDKDLWLRLLEVGRLANLREPLLYYRQHPKTITSQHAAAQRRLTCQAVQDACRRRGVPFPRRLQRKWARPKSRFRLYCSWSKRARRFGNLRAARKYGRKAVALRPWRPDAWSLWLLAVAGSFFAGRNGDAPQAMRPALRLLPTPPGGAAPKAPLGRGTADGGVRSASA